MLIGALMVAAPAVSHAATTIVTDGSFEKKGTDGSVSNYCYDGFAAGGNPACASSAWTGSGVVRSGNGAWGGTTTPDGSYFAIVQGGQNLSQTVNLHVGQYTFSWLDAARSGNPSGGLQTYIASIGGTVLGSYTPTPGTPFGAQSVTVLIGTAGSKVLSFAGQSNADNTAFIDSVSIAAVPEPGVWAMMIAGFGFVGAALRRRKVGALRFA